MKFCLIPQKVQEFKKALKEKQIDFVSLMNMTTAERTKVLEHYAGDNAHDVNLLFEQKLVLKNRILGIKNWASKVGEIGRYDPAKKAEIAKKLKEYRAKQTERIFSPAENDAFLADLAETKLGVKITREEAKTVFDLSKQVEDGLRKNFHAESGQWRSPEAEAQYGATKVALENYVEQMKNPELTIKETLDVRIAKAKQDFKTNAPKAVYELSTDTIQAVADNSVSLVATLDNSFLGRQGLTTLMTHPSAWYPAAKASFVNFAKVLGGDKAVMDAVMATVYSQPNHINGRYEMAGILPKLEEQFPTTLGEKIWGIGRLLKASEVAFKGSAIMMRTKSFDLLAGIAEKNQVEMTKVQIKDIGTLINAATARGKWGKTGEPAIVRMVLWAPKMLKGNWDVLTAHTLGAGLDTAFARKQAAINLAKVIAEIGAVMGMMDAIIPGSVEWDPHSSDFGKIRFGNTRFDITGGKAALVVLAARMLPKALGGGYTKSTTTGKLTELAPGFGQTTRFDVAVNFLVNKTNPPAHVVADFLKGENFQGDKPTLASSAFSAGVPIILQQAINLKDDHSVAAVLGVLSDGIGIGSNTYEPFKSNWNKDPGKELTQLRTKIGQSAFDDANKQFNETLAQKLMKLTQSENYKALSAENKGKIITKLKDQEKESIFKKYHFKYKQDTTGNAQNNRTLDSMIRSLNVP